MASRPKSSALALMSPALAWRIRLRGRGGQTGKDLSFSLVGRAESGPPRRSERGGRAKGVDGRRGDRAVVPNALRHGLSAMDSLMLDSFTTVSYATTRAFQDCGRSAHPTAAWRPPRLGGFVPHLGSREADRPPRSRLSPRLSVFVRAVFLRGRRPRRERVMAPRGRLARRRRFLHSSPGLTVTIRFQTTVCSGSKSSESFHRSPPPVKKRRFHQEQGGLAC